MRSLVVLIAIVATVSLSTAKDELQAGDLVKQHLNSIGTQQARDAVKSRLAEGVVQFHVLSGGTGNEDGKQVFVSEGNKFVTLLKLPNPSYHGERFVSDGQKTTIGYVTPGNYSNFGEFVHVHDEIFTEGLWGGVLSTGWVLANLENHHGKLHYEGLRKIGGRELHQLRYEPAKRSDLEILLYFEPTTFRHVMTSYSLTIDPQLARRERENAQQQSSHYRLEERFSDFKDTDKLSLPGRWVIQFTVDNPINPVGRDAAAWGNSATARRANLAVAQTSVVEFSITETSISHNVQLDPRNFEIK